MVEHRVGWCWAISLKTAEPMRLTGSNFLLMVAEGKSRDTIHQTLHIKHWNAEGLRQDTWTSEIPHNSANRCLLRPGDPSRQHQQILHPQTDQKVEFSHSFNPVYHPWRSRDQRKLTWKTSPLSSFFPTETWSSVTSPSSNKTLHLHTFQPNSGDRMIVRDFNSRSPSLGYHSLDAGGERSGTLDC